MEAVPRCYPVCVTSSLERVNNNGDGTSNKRKMLSCEVSEKGRGRSCVKIEVAVLDSLYLSTYGLCGRKATLNSNHCGSELRSCVNVEVAVLDSHFLTVLMVSVDVRQHLKKKRLSGSELRSCVKVEVAVLGSPSLIVRMDFVDVKLH